MNKLPEADLINDPDIRAETKLAIRNFPDYFWEIPAASSYRHHNPYCCEKYGLWIHTKMVVTEYLETVASDVERDRLSKREADMGLSACLLHDSWKVGKPPVDDNGRATKNHDLIAAEFVEETTDLPQEVADAVASHMGPWYEGPEPDTILQEVVHKADISATKKNGTPGVYEPHSKIERYYPSIPRAEFTRKGIYR